MDLKSTYNRIATDWHDDHKNDDWSIEGMDLFISLLPKGARVLDVGCAGGRKSKYLADRGIVVHGIDFSEKFLEIARKEAPQATFEIMDMHDLSRLAGDFDGVFASASLLHISKKEITNVLRGLVSKLKPGGYFYAAVKKQKEGGVEEETKEDTGYGYPYQRFFSYYTPEEFERLLERVGLSLVRTTVTLSGKTYWIQVIARKGF
jgi:SAM-dependent methyltransferase